MNPEAFREIIGRYSPLGQLLRSISSSLEEDGPASNLLVRFATGVADESFKRLPCRTCDGVFSLLRSHDGRTEGRQTTILLSYDRDQRWLGRHEWLPGYPVTPKDVLGKGAFGRKAQDFALVTHREWFNAGELPVGIPDWEKAPTGMVRAELNITIYGRSGAPSTWTARR